MTPSPLEHDHTPAAIRKRLSGQPTPNYIRDFVYGGIDGAITTFAIVSGVEGAELSHRAIIILGFANLIADGLSMAASNYTGTKTEIEDYERLEAIERKHILVTPSGETEEIRQILSAKGLEGETLETAVKAITSDEDRWVKTMLTEEYGVALALRSPLRAAASTFAAFVLCGLVPLIPFLFALPNAFAISIVMTGIVFIAIGSAKSRWSLVPWWKSGLETLLIGASAAGAAYLIGNILKSVV